jgi:DNA-directed RNA polymerase subunit RPC12/RpoP
MPVLVTCYKCGRKLRIHDSLIGRKARCPVCKSIFMTEGNPPDLPAAAEPEIHVADYGSAPPVRRPSTSPSPEEEVLEGILHENDKGTAEPRYPRPIRRRRLKKVYQGDWRKVRVGVTIILSSVILLCLTMLLAGGQC